MLVGNQPFDHAPHLHPRRIRGDVDEARFSEFAESRLLRFTTKQQWAPAGGNWGWYFNQEVEDLIAEALRTFDDEIRDITLSRVHEIASRDAIMLFVVHDLNPRALSPKLRGFVQAQNWFQDLTPIVVGE